MRVYVGAQFPLLHDYNSYQLELLLFGPRTAYVAAYRTPPPGPGDIVPPPDGFATHTRAAKKDAVRFLIETIHRYPHEVTILAIGPLTNLALAIREDPAIVPLIKHIVIMGGQIYAPGNAFQDAGEFNWCRTSSIARKCTAAHCPARCDEYGPSFPGLYDQIASHTPPTIITQLYKEGVQPGDFVYDTIAFASFYDPSLAVDTRDLYVDINTTFDRNYGKSIVRGLESVPLD